MTFFISCEIDVYKRQVLDFCLAGLHGLRPRQPKIPSTCPLLFGRLVLHRWLYCPQTEPPVLQRWGGSSRSRHAHRSYRSPAAFQAMFAPGNSVSQMPAAPFLPVCRSRGCRYSSKYHQGQQDVYKRQTIRREKSSVCKDDPALLQKFFTKPVSYTHLDVYKRQPPYRMPLNHITAAPRKQTRANGPTTEN